MATYVPFTLIVPKAMGISTSISTWESRETVSGAIHRNTVFSTSGTASVTVQMGTTGAETGTQNIMNAQALTANVSTNAPWTWMVVPVSSYFHGFASTGVPVVTAVSSGYLTS